MPGSAIRVLRCRRRISLRRIGQKPTWPWSSKGVGDKTAKPALSATESGEAGEAPSGEQSGAVVTYFEAKGFGFLRPDDGGRDIFFHVSRLVEGLATDLRPGTRVMYELGMDRTGKMAASSIRIPPPA